jgi:hypothetical protein
MGWYLGQFSQEEAATKALKMIHAHERFHFRFDAWALHLEEAAGKALYEAYKKCVYQNLYPHPLVVEESLANNHAYRSMRGEGISEFLRYFMDSQPGAYREYQERTDKYHEGAEINRGRLCAQLLNPLDVICAVAQEGAIQEGWMRRLSSPKGGAAISQDEMCPTYIISGARISDILPPSALGAPSLKEIKRFVKGYLGGKLLERTDHDYYRIDNGAKMKMPNPHANTDCCKPQEFNNIRMKAGMLTADYKSERSKTRVWRRSVPRLAPKQPIV